MKIHRSFILILITLLILGLAACVRAIPGSSKATTPTAEQSSVLPTSPTDVMNQIYLFATQTAMAKVETTPEAQIVTETPAAPEATKSLAPTANQFVSPTATYMPSPPVTRAAAPPLVVPTSYSLKKGEFPYCIARRFDVNPSELLRINGLSSGSVVHTGMILMIPQTGHVFPGNRALRAHPTDYVARYDDTIYTIACFFGDADPNAIAVVNGLTPPYTLTSGQVLYIP